MLPSGWDDQGRYKLVPWLLLITLFALAIIALGVFFDYQRTITTTTVESDQRMTQLTAVRIGDELANFSNALVALARSEEILSQDPELQAAALEQSGPIQEGLFDGGIVLLNNFGTVTAAAPSRPDILQQDWSGRTYFRELLNGSPFSVVFSNAMSDGPSGTPVVVISVPIFDREGRFEGAIAGMLRLSQSTISPFYATLVKLRVNPDGAAFVLDRSGRILFDTASQQDGEQYLDQRLLDSDNAQPVRTNGVAGREILLTQAQIPDTPWTLVVENDWENLVALTQIQVNSLWALLGLGALLPLAGLILLFRRRKRHRNSGASGRASHLAYQIEDAMLPPPIPILPGWEIIVHREPAPVVGRVFHELLLGVDGCLTLIIAETSKAGAVGRDSTPDVFAMVAARTLLRSAARDLLAPAQALERANQLLCPDMPPGDYITCLYCRLDPTSGAIYISNADHVQPLKVADAGIDVVGGKNSPLALQLESHYGEYTSSLAEGDCMLFCGSEVLDAYNAEGEKFGLARLQAALNTPAAAGAQRIAAVTSALREFAGGNWANDRDAILIVVERLPNGASLAQL